MSSLGEFHHTEEAPSKGSRIVAWVVIALLVGAAALYVVESGMLNAAPTQTRQTYPRGM
ncbi:MAG: hypothetical protein ACXWLX_05430 [Rhizomicrobium sp.]